ncbi:MAG: ABC transporter permease [Nitratireductor sp.]|nr:ABC transporter permease [Nitratireductor sp.]MCB1457686.1 ABC transporter permease [Nitratireductor sp.]
MTGTGSQRLAGSGSIGLAWRLALRELRGGLSGFYIFLGCIAIGAAAISGVNSVAGSIAGGIAEQGRAILGGDAAVSLVQQEPPERAQALLRSLGDVSVSTNLRAMARREDGSEQVLAEVKAADDSYPLFGQLRGNLGSGPETVIDWGAFGNDSVLVDPLLLERLQLKSGDRLALGDRSFAIGGTIANEPDRISEGMIFGPRILMKPVALREAGLIRPGSLFRDNRAVRLNDDSAAGLARFMQQAQELAPETGWRIRSRENAAPSLSRSLDRFSQFLTLVGLTALIVGGVGVANSVHAFLERKRPVIATLKSVGASGNLIFNIYLIQIMVLAMVGIAVGLIFGAMMPVVAKWALAGLLPVSSASVFQPAALFMGTVYGLLTALVFATWPLAVARETEAASLFRSSGFVTRRFPRVGYLLLIAAGIAAMAAMAILTASNKFIAIVFLLSVAVAFLLLRAVAWGLQWLARMAPRVHNTQLRLALGNIHRPGSVTPSVTLSLGLGLSLIVALTMIDSSLRQQVSGNLPERAPDFFFLDVRNTEIDQFRTRIEQLAPGSKLDAVPMMRGRITRLRGIAAEDYPVEEGGAWVLRGDRGITFSQSIPDNATLASGEWWPKDYSGPPLVSFAAEEAGELGLKVGDELVVNVLGRPVTARIANLRAVEWESLAINFVMVFSPNSFAGAPFGYLATLTTAQEQADRTGSVSGNSAVTVDDSTIMRALATEFPSAVTVRVRDVLETINSLVRQLGSAIRAASAVALVSSILVLAGALAAGNQARSRDAVILKTLGARRSALLAAFVSEYAMIGIATALFALVAGGAAAWFVVTQIMEFRLWVEPSAPLVVLAVSLGVTIGVGLLATWRILGQKAAPHLREL